MIGSHTEGTGDEIGEICHVNIVLNQSPNFHTVNNFMGDLRATQTV